MLPVKLSGVAEEALSILKCVGDFFFSVRVCVCSVTDTKRQLVASTAINPDTAAQIQSRYTEAETTGERRKTSRIICDRHTSWDCITPLGFIFQT